MATIASNEQVHKLVRQGVPFSKMKKLLGKSSNGGDLNMLDSDQQTLLHTASSVGNLDLVRWLLKQGVDVNLQDMNGFTPLHGAAITGNLDACKVLLQSKNIKVDLTNVEKTSVLHYLVRIQITDDTQEKWEEVLDLILAKGINVNIRNRHGESPLHSALLKENERAIQYLLTRQADTNLQNASGETSLHYAVRCNNVRLVVELMEQGADPTIAANDGSTPVDVATEYNANEILDVIQSLIAEALEESEATPLPESSGSLKRHASLRATQKEGLVLTPTADRNLPWEPHWLAISFKTLTLYSDSQKSQVLVDINMNKATFNSSGQSVPADQSLNVFEVIEEDEARIEAAIKSTEDYKEWSDQITAILNSHTRLKAVYKKLQSLSTPLKTLRATAREEASERTKRGMKMMETYLAESAASAADSSQPRNFEKLSKIMLDDIPTTIAALNELVTIDDDEFLESFMAFYESQGKLIEVIKEDISFVISKTTTAQTMFRGLSIATKLLQLYMSGNEGSVYLKSTVLKLVHDISSIDHSLEVNPKMAEKGIDVNGNLNKLLFHAQRFLELIISSAEKCPVVFREALAHAAKKVEEFFPNMYYAVVGGFIFLRLICPAVVMPQKYRLLTESPPPTALRALVLISKLLQSLANGVEFDGSKEEYMKKLNPYIKKNKIAVEVFFDQLTNEQSIRKAKEAEHLVKLPLDSAICVHALEVIDTFLQSKTNRVQEFIYGKKPKTPVTSSTTSDTIQTTTTTTTTTRSPTATLLPLSASSSSSSSSSFQPLPSLPPPSPGRTGQSISPKRELTDSQESNSRESSPVNTPTPSSSANRSGGVTINLNMNSLSSSACNSPNSGSSSAHDSSCNDASRSKSPKSPKALLALLKSAVIDDHPKTPVLVTTNVSEGAVPVALSSSGGGGSLKAKSPKRRRSLNSIFNEDDIISDDDGLEVEAQKANDTRHASPTTAVSAVPGSPPPPALSSGRIKRNRRNSENEETLALSKDKKKRLSSAFKKRDAKAKCMSVSDLSSYTAAATMPELNLDDITAHRSDRRIIIIDGDTIVEEPDAPRPSHVKYFADTIFIPSSSSNSSNSSSSSSSSGSSSSGSS